MNSAVRDIWFLIVPRTSMINVAGPWEVLGHANDLLGREVYRLSAFGVKSPDTGTRFGLVLGGLQPLPRRISAYPDTVVVAGGSPAEPLPEDHQPAIDFLAKHRDRWKRVVSVCTGAFSLARAGMLDGRKATTHWMYLDEMRRRFPKVKVLDAGVFVHDKNIWTSAGVTAGVDLALALVEQDHGHALAMRVAKRMVLFLRRTGQQAQFSTVLMTQEKESPQLKNLSAFVLEHLDEPLSIERIAEHVGASPRTLSRWCRKHLQESPASLVRRLRLAEARRMLEETDITLKELAARTGLGDQSTLWRVFTTDLGVTPAEYRQRFSA